MLGTVSHLFTSMLLGVPTVHTPDIGYLCGVYARYILNPKLSLGTESLAFPVWSSCICERRGKWAADLNMFRIAWLQSPPALNPTPETINPQPPNTNSSPKCKMIALLGYFEGIWAIVLLPPAFRHTLKSLMPKP